MEVSMYTLVCHSKDVQMCWYLYICWYCQNGMKDYDMHWNMLVKVEIFKPVERVPLEYDDIRWSDGIRWLAEISGHKCLSVTVLLNSLSIILGIKSCIIYHGFLNAT